MNVIIKKIILLLYKNLNDNKSMLIIWIPVLQGVGIIAYFSLNREPQDDLLIYLACLLLVSLVFICLKKYSILFLSIFFVVLGFISVQVKAHYFVRNTLRHQVYVRNVVARVKEISTKQSYKRLIVCDIKNSQYKIKCVRLEVRTKLDNRIVIGDIVQFSAIIYPPSAAVSPFSYDFSRIAYFKNISAVGFTISNVYLLKKNRNRQIIEYIELVRFGIYKILLRSLTEDSANILSALLIGKKEGIKDDIMDAIRNTGIAHLFAISGLHLSFIAGLFFTLLRNLLVLFTRFAERYNIKKISAVIAIVMSLIYLLIAGMPVSAQRAFIMVSCIFIGVLIDRNHNNLCSIAIASFVILLINPESLLSPSFQMSFAAVLALVASRNIFLRLVMMNNILQYFLSIILSSLIASLATLPYVIYHFNYFSIAGVFANLLAIPITTFFIMPLGLLYIVLGIVNLEFCISWMVESSVRVLIHITQYISKINGLIVLLHAFSSVSILVITLGFLFLCLWKGSVRFYGLILIVLGVFIGINYITPDVIVNQYNIVVKESDGKLYAINQKAHLTSFVNLTWARQNGQGEMLRPYFGSNKYLSCKKSEGCIYSKLGKNVLIAYNADYIMRNCLNVDLIVQGKKFIYPDKCITQHIDYSDIRESYVVWVTNNSIKIDKISGSRIWNT
ncbi:MULTISPECIES: ComEC/Rec2 family competence protein [Ehrlichia]|uniref:ComEC/Rec2-related domain protein n=1 Tax=Ehrlichia cf. muris str. EmCRT TaxID=1359167 RepID=A0A0F3NBL7_9RICK|nr:MULTISPECIES: ComEC/Rec2 family competence protein [Ehrlichia]KJV65445.1 comEC/Rec2-related domain protein [Ehrlichia cf. muris str. EmCRT]OUC04608.1 competence protein [Ehrlichia sp. Wisconsin_h]